MKPTLIRTLLWISLLLPIAAAGFIVGSLTADDGAEIAKLDATNARLNDRATRLARQRDLLRADRNQLERQLAARAPRAICPDTYVSTEAVDLLDSFEIEYRCGWHVSHDAQTRGGGEERPGARVTLTLFSRLPIRLGSGVPAADIELGDWIDDPEVEGDDLAPLSEWLEDERGAFTQPFEERRFRSADETVIHQISGTARAGEDSVALAVMLWEYEDTATGARHVIRAAAVDPSEQVRAALARLGRSFRVLTPE